MKSKVQRVFENCFKLIDIVPALKQVEEASACSSFYQMWSSPRCGCCNPVNQDTIFYDQINQAKREAEAEAQRVLSNWRPPTPLEDDSRDTPTARKLFSAVSHPGASEDKE